MTMDTPIPTRKKIRVRASLFASVAALSSIHMICAGVMIAGADGVDDLIARRMQERKITGLSLAIVDDGRIVKAQGYGFADETNGTAVTTDTLFQAGSISKPVAASGALHLVEQNRLSLDADVNTRLSTWKIPENEFTKAKKVTLRGILSHSAGLTVHGFPGYSVDRNSWSSMSRANPSRASCAIPC